MKKVIKNPVIKIIIILIILILVKNIIFPKETNAFISSKDIANFINSILQFLMFLADLLLKLLQNIMIGTDKITGIGGDSKIMYSPGMIFLNKVPGLKVNFVTANQNDNQSFECGTFNSLSTVQSATNRAKNKEKETIIYTNSVDMSDIKMDQRYLNYLNLSWDSYLAGTEATEDKIFEEYNIGYHEITFTFYFDDSSWEAAMAVPLPVYKGFESEQWLFIGEDEDFWELTYYQGKNNGYCIPSYIGSKLKKDYKDLYNNLGSFFGTPDKSYELTNGGKFHPVVCSLWYDQEYLYGFAWYFSESSGFGIEGEYGCYVNR